MTKKHTLDEERIPRQLVQHRPRLPGAARASAAPRDQAAGRPRRPGADLPHGPHHAGSLDGALHRHPRRGAREIYRIWRPTPLIRATGLEKKLGSARRGAHLLQARGREPSRLAQVEHRRGAGLLQQAGRRRRASPPRPAPASGAAPWRWPASSSASISPSTWSR